MPSHVLLASSDPALRQTYLSYFRSIGFQVEAVADGLECLDRLRHDQPDALVVDIDLPWGGGDGVISCLSGDEGLRPRAVVALGSVTPAELSGCVGLPQRDCLQKPAHASSLLLRLATRLLAVAPSSVA